jgi:hypothetical protein
LVSRQVKTTEVGRSTDLSNCGRKPAWVKVVVVEMERGNLRGEISSIWKVIDY